MVYIKHWLEFQSQSLDLFKKHPERTRYLIKSHPGRQWLVLKVTDDFTVLKYKSRSTVILNRFEGFNRELTSLMAGIEPATSSEATQEQTTAAVAAAAGTPGATSEGAGAGTAATGAGGAAAGGGGKKKKKKGGKK